MSRRDDVAAQIPDPEFSQTPLGAMSESNAATTRSPFKVGDRVIRKYDGKVGVVEGIDVKGRLSVHFNDGTHSILPALPHTYQRSTRG